MLFRLLLVSAFLTISYLSYAMESGQNAFGNESPKKQEEEFDILKAVGYVAPKDVCDIIINLCIDKSLYKKLDFPLRKVVANPITLTGHTDTIRSICRIDDNTLASGSDDSTIKIWDWKNQKELHTFYGHTGRVKCLCPLTNNTIASAAEDGTIKLWNLTTKAEVTLASGVVNVSSLCLLPGRGDKLVSGFDDGTIKIWDLKNNTLIATLIGHQDKVKCLYPLGEDIFASGSGFTIKIWKKDQEIGVLNGHQGIIHSLCLLNKDKLISGSSQHEIKIWDLKNNELVKPFSLSDIITGICSFSEDKFICGCFDGDVHIVDLKKNIRIPCAKKAGSSVYALELLAKDHKFVCGGTGNIIAIYDIKKQLSGVDYLERLTKLPTMQKFIFALNQAHVKNQKLTLSPNDLSFYHAYQLLPNFMQNAFSDLIDFKE